MNETQSWIEYLLTLNDKLLGLPGLPLVILFGICIGYAIKGFPKISNSLIPLIVMVSCSLAYLLLCLGQIPVGLRGVEVVSMVFRYFVLGLIGGAVAWLLHNKLLKRFEESTDTPPKP